MALTDGYWHVALALLLTFSTYIICKGWHSRRLFYKLRQQRLVSLISPPPVEMSDTWKPMPAWNIVTGNMLALLPLLKQFPSNAHQNYLITEISKEFKEWDSAFYLDL